MPEPQVLNQNQQNNNQQTGNNPSQQPDGNQNQTTPVDLISRVSQFKPESGKSSTDEPIFDTKEYEKVRDSITDPVQKDLFEKKMKSLDAGFTKKFQEVADLRKQVEQQANQRKVWTADTIQRELLSDPVFVAEAQRLASINPNPANPNNSGLTDQEWSALNAQEKAALQQANARSVEAERRIQQLEQQTQNAMLQQQHQALKTKYANYSPDFVDTTVRDVVQGKRQITLEDVWKATDYENAVNRAYELGKSDALGKNQTRVQSSSFQGGQMTQSGPAIEAQKGESNLSFFKRIASARLAESKTR